MPHMRRIWTAMLTRNVSQSATDSRPVLIMNEDGFDRLHHTFGETPQDDQEQGEANLYEVSVASQRITPENLNNSSIRMGIRGDDAWRPEHILVWGERFTGGSIVPIAVETGLTTTLSTDASEGRLSVPLRKVALGLSTMPIRRLLVLMTTSNQRNAGTNSTIELQIRSGTNLVVSSRIPDTPQSDQERAQANLYFVSVSAPFTKRSLTDSSMRLSIQGTDAWLPASFFVFGLDDASGRPESMVPLVHFRTWPFRQLSTDSGEGVASVTLPLAL